MLNVITTTPWKFVGMFGMISRSYSSGRIKSLSARDPAIRTVLGAHNSLSFCVVQSMASEKGRRDANPHLADGPRQTGRQFRLFGMSKTMDDWMAEGVYNST
jgi:hypothetical protein